jgi:20S proteasome alpha/beta subunit
MYDGFISDHHGWCVIGGNVEDVESVLRSDYAEALPLGGAVKLGRKALENGSNGSSELPAENLEACVLDQALAARKFRRLSTDEVRGMLDA